jgi:hypothetical protein
LLRITAVFYRMNGEVMNEEMIQWRQ